MVWGEERRDGARLSALCWLESAAVVGGLMVIAASIGSCKLRDREKQKLGDEEGGCHFGRELYPRQPTAYL